MCVRVRVCVRVRARARPCRVGVAGTGRVRVGRKTSETEWQGGERPGPVGQKFSGSARLWLSWGKGRRERLRHPHPA